MSVPPPEGRQALRLGWRRWSGTRRLTPVNGVRIVVSRGYQCRHRIRPRGGTPASPDTAPSSASCSAVGGRAA